MSLEISVVVPAFNQEAFLARALESVQCQTHPPRELIVVDDGSSDRTAEIARSFKGVVLLQQENAERGAARNAGIRLATAEWIALLDADDEWLPTHLEHAAATIENCRCDVTFGAFEIVDSKMAVRVKRPLAVRAFSDRTRAFRRLDSGGLCSSNIVARRATLIERPFSEVRAMSGSEDWHCWVRLWLHSTIVPFGALTTRYHLHGNNTVLDSARMQIAMRTAVQDLATLPELAPYRRRAERRLHLFSAGMVRAAGQPRSALRMVSEGIRSDPATLFEVRLWRTGIRAALDIVFGKPQATDST